MVVKDGANLHERIYLTKDFTRKEFPNNFPFQCNMLKIRALFSVRKLSHMSCFRKWYAAFRQIPLVCRLC